MDVVLLGGDLSAYSAAVSFHAEFGVRSTAFCRYRCGITGYSSLIDLCIEPNILNDEIGTETLLAFAKEKKERPYLIPCGDWYAAFLSRNRARLQNAYRFLLPSRELFERVSDKAAFYAMLEKEGLPYPKTAVLSSDDLSLAVFSSFEKYPAVLKPSQSVCYYNHPFPDMKKVYFPKSPQEAMEVAERIFASGYNEKLILQQRIGSDAAPPVSKTLTLLSDGEGRVRRGALGEVLIEERAPGARGNYAAILTRPPDSLTVRLISFLEKIGYIGAANFDILFYEGRHYVLELNPRQGRSCDYLRACGVSLARFLVDAIDRMPMKTDLSSRVGVWHAVPLGVVLRRMEVRDRHVFRVLRQKGRVVAAFGYEGEQKTLKRSAYLKIHALRRTLALVGRKERKYEKHGRKKNGCHHPRSRCECRDSGRL